MAFQQNNDIDVGDTVRLLYSRLFRTRWDVVYVALLLLCGGFVYLQGLGRPVAIWDETFYMTAAQFSVEHGYWLVPHVPYETFGPRPTTQVGSQPFFLKTPLAIWFQMLSMELFGTTAVAARLPAVVFTLLTAVLVYYLGRAIYSRKTGFIGGIVVLTTHLIFAGGHGGRTAAFDVPMLFFGTLAVSAVFLGVRRDYPKMVLFPVAGVALAGAILVKGFNAGVFGIIVLPLLIVYWREFFTREGILAAGLAAAIPLAWFAVAELLYGSVLIPMLYEQVINRVTGQIGSDPATFGFMKAPYFRNAPRTFDPWWYLFLTSLVTVPLGIYRRRGQSKLGTDTLFLCWWALSVFGFFVLAGNHIWYVMPMVVPVGLLCGRLIDRGFRPSPEAAGLAVGLYLTFMNTPLVGRAIPFVTQGVLPPLPPVRFALAVGTVGVLLAVVYRKQWVPAIQPEIDLTRWTGTTKRAFTVLLVVLVLLQIPMAAGGPDTRDQQQLGNHISSVTDSDTTIYLHSSAYVAIYPFVFYAERPLQEATLQQLNTDSDIQYALVGKSVVKKLRRPHDRIGTMTAWKSDLVLIEFSNSTRSKLQAIRWRHSTQSLHLPRIS